MIRVSDEGNFVLQIARLVSIRAWSVSADRSIERCSLLRGLICI